MTPTRLIDAVKDFGPPSRLAAAPQAVNRLPRTIDSYLRIGGQFAAYLAVHGTPTAAASISREHVAPAVLAGRPTRALEHARPTEGVTGRTRLVRLVPKAGLGTSRMRLPACPAACTAGGGRGSVSSHFVCLGGWMVDVQGVDPRPDEADAKGSGARAGQGGRILPGP